jgi:hypothetical protein
MKTKAVIAAYLLTKLLMLGFLFFRLEGRRVVLKRARRA